MSSSPYRRVTVEIENGTDIQYIGYKGLRQVYLYFVQIYGGVYKYCRHTSTKFNFKGLERRLVAACYDNHDNQTPLTHKEHIEVVRPFKLLNLFSALQSA